MQKSDIFLIIGGIIVALLLGILYEISEIVEYQEPEIVGAEIEIEKSTKEELCLSLRGEYSTRTSHGEWTSYGKFFVLCERDGIKYLYDRDENGFVRKQIFKLAPIGELIYFEY